MLTIKAKIRKKISKNTNKRIRKSKRIPAILYGKNEPNININIEEKIINNIKNKCNIYKKILKLNINNIEQTVKVKSIQQHPYKEKIIHIDFIHARIKN